MKQGIAGSIFMGNIVLLAFHSSSWMCGNTSSILWTIVHAGTAVFMALTWRSR